jgi:hypothetical protein
MKQFFFTMGQNAVVKEARDAITKRTTWDNAVDRQSGAW